MSNDHLLFACLTQLWLLLTAHRRLLFPSLTVRSHALCLTAHPHLTLSDCHICTALASARVDTPLQLFLPEVSVGLLPGVIGTCCTGPPLAHINTTAPTSSRTHLDSTAAIPYFNCYFEAPHTLSHTPQLSFSCCTCSSRRSGL
jgi:hypothetical protein